MLHLTLTKTLHMGAASAMAVLFLLEGSDEPARPVAPLLSEHKALCTPMTCRTGADAATEALRQPQQYVAPNAVERFRFATLIPASGHGQLSDANPAPNRDAQPIPAVAGATNDRQAHIARLQMPRHFGPPHPLLAAEQPSRPAPAQPPHPAASDAVAGLAMPVMPTPPDPSLFAAEDTVPPSASEPATTQPAMPPPKRALAGSTASAEASQSLQRRVAPRRPRARRKTALQVKAEPDEYAWLFQDFPDWAHFESRR